MFINENDAKRAFKRHVALSGGMCYSLDPTHHTGLPDMCMCYPGYAPIFLECKIVRYVMKGGPYKICYSKPQINLLREVDKVSPNCAWGAIFIKPVHGVCDLVFVHPSHEHISDNYRDIHAVVEYFKNGKFDGIEEALDKMNVPKADGG